MLEEELSETHELEATPSPGAGRLFHRWCRMKCHSAEPPLLLSGVALGNDVTLGGGFMESVSKALDAWL